MFGQYSAGHVGKRTKRDMVTDATRDHGAIFSPEKIENNTLRFRTADGRTIIRLHETDILSTDKRGNITLSSGGWRSVTTKARLRHYLPAGWAIWSEKGSWLVKTPEGLFPFADGARFTAAGKPLNLAMMERAGNRVARDKALVAKFLRKAKEKGWADPAGDPWVFSLPSRETMLDWLRGGYFTARLMALALADRFGDGGVALYMSDIARNGGKPRSAYEIGILRKYIYKSLGIS